MATTINVDVVVPRSAASVNPRLDALLGSIRDRGLVRVGPGRPRWVAKHVRTRSGNPHMSGRTSVTKLRWTPIGRASSLFPTLNGDVAVTPINDVSCLLTIAGGYQPPLGRMGRALDRVVLHRVASSTAGEFANRLGHALVSMRQEGLS